MVEIADITLRRLRCLIAVSDTGRFREAAALLGVAQPSLSAQILALEEALGQRLLERGRSGAALTPIGREVVARARRIEAEARGIAELALAARDDLVGTIRLGAKPTLGPYLLPQVVAELHARHPELKLYIREAPPRELERELLDGVHDIILAQGPISDERLTTRRLFRERLLLAMAADHPLVARKTISRDDLKGETILSLSPAYHLHGLVDAIRRDGGARFSGEYEGTSLDALRQMVGMGMGLAVLPAFYVRSEIRPRAEVVVRPIGFAAPWRDILLVWRKAAGRATAFEQLADAIRTVAQKAEET